MGASELAEWMEYSRIQPFGPQRDNLHAAMICSILANQSKRRGARASMPNDFMLKPPDDRRRDETARTVNWLKSIAKPRKAA